MKKQGIINGELMRALTELRHEDSIAICDVGMPIPKECYFIDLSLVPGIPSFLDVTKAVLNEIIVERVSFFEPMTEYSPKMYETLCGMMKAQEKDLIAQGDPFAEALKKTKVILRTAEYTPGCNMILYSASGVEEFSKKYDVSFEL